ncbi:MAG: DUF2442 domain-containing protein [Novosphingobium sp.]|nr:DUF2442 domain-containing protein [Novosphingobium sp.]
MSIGKLTSLAVAADQALSLEWDDGRSARVDLTSVIGLREALAQLADPGEFAKARLSEDGWSVEWPGGLDFGAAQLRRWADEQAGEAMAASAFRAWMNGHGFTLDHAAEALGLSRRTVAYYLSGEQPVPRTVMLATRGFDQQQAA